MYPHARQNPPRGNRITRNRMGGSRHFLFLAKISSRPKQSQALYTKRKSAIVISHRFKFSLRSSARRERVLKDRGRFGRSVCRLFFYNKFIEVVSALAARVAALARPRQVNS